MRSWPEPEHAGERRAPTERTFTWRSAVLGVSTGDAKLALTALTCQAPALALPWASGGAIALAADGTFEYRSRISGQLRMVSSTLARK